MASLHHLEKMGKELKCPICLSLLRSAMSIPCNHIFCSCCISELMKSSLSCPVCKAPFRRRELRAAPHMDSLVSIFKSMEVATGTSIMSTQLAPDSKVIGDLGNSNCKLQPSQSKGEKVENKRLPTKKDNILESTENGAHGLQRQPSCPAKKRVHVTPIPLMDTPTRPVKASTLQENEERNDSEVGDIVKISSDKEKSISLSPFFWLREEEGEEDADDAEYLSSLPSQEPSAPMLPCFSDLKDSDEDITSNTTPNSKSKVVEAFDSEIFEWTQRACSPEFCLSPSGEKTPEEEHHEVSCDDKSRAGDDKESPKMVESTGRKRRPCAKGQKGRKNSKMSQPEDPANNVSIDSASNHIKQGGYNEYMEMTASEEANCVNRSVAKRRRQTIMNIVSRASGVEENIASDVQPSLFKAALSGKKSRGKRARVEPKKFESIVNTILDTEAPQAIDEHGSIIPDSQLVSSTFLQERTPSLMKCSIKQKLVSSKDNADIVGRSSRQSASTKKETITLKVTNDATSDGSPALDLRTSKRKKPKNVHSETYRERDSGAVEELEKIEEPVGDSASINCKNVSAEKYCAFCHKSSTAEVTGEMVHYLNGRKESADFGGQSNIVHAHMHCLEWTPDVYFEGESVINLTAELKRSRRIKCSCCGIRGAALGCFDKTCRRSFHFPCAKLTPECRWDTENFVMLCPLHRSSKLPIELPHGQPGKQPTKRAVSKGTSDLGECSNAPVTMWSWHSGSPCKWLLSCSALSASEKDIVAEFARLAGLRMSKTWKPDVTHVITTTDASGACKRTLKFLMAILNGRWIVSIDWVRECIATMAPVDEEKFEVTVDAHGIRDGPRLGRLRVTNKEPKLLDGFSFYFSGDFAPSYRGYLRDLIIAAGGGVLQRKPVSRDQQKLLDDDMSCAFVVYNIEDDSKSGIAGRRSEAQSLANASGCRAVSSAWILDTIAACKLQPFQ